MMSKMDQSALTWEKMQDGTLAVQTTETLMVLTQSRYKELLHFEKLLNDMHLDVDEKQLVLEQEQKSLKKQNTTLEADIKMPADRVAVTPVFPDQTLALVKVMRRQSPADLSRLMNLSDALARLNVDRYAAWVDAPDARLARQAALAFNGDVYEGLRAPEFSDAKAVLGPGPSGHPEWPLRRVASPGPDPALSAGDGHSPAHAARRYALCLLGRPDCAVAEPTPGRLAGENGSCSIWPRTSISSRWIRRPCAPGWWNACSRTRKMAPGKSSVSMPSARGD
ncbi:hypothetical protein LSPH26S_05009 [Lysinibacillus sphaericus]